MYPVDAAPAQFLVHFVECISSYELPYRRRFFPLLSLFLYLQKRFSAITRLGSLTFSLFVCLSLFTIYYNRDVSIIEIIIHFWEFEH